MPPRFDEVARRKVLEKKATEVAGCFRLGDSNLVGELISVMDAYFGEYYRPHKAAMHRLLQAAKIMEEKE